MALQMTRAEYEKKYGVAPPMPTMTFDTTPAPMRMTREEYTTRYGYDPKVSVVQSDKGYLGRINETFQAGADMASDSWVNAGKNIVSDFERLSDPSQGPLAARTGAAVGHLAGNIAGAAIGTAMGVGKTILAPFSQIKTNDGDTVGQRVAEPLKAETNKAISAVDKAIPQIKQTWQNLHPELQKSLVDVLNTTGLMGAGILKAPVRNPLGAAETIIGDAADIAVGARETLAQARKGLAERSATRTIAQREKELYDIETNYAKTRNAMDYSKDAGAASRARIAETDVLVGAVDENGVLRTRQPGGAVEQYRAQTIEGVESIVRQGLEREAATVNLVEVTKALQAQIRKSGLEGADLITALNGVRKEIQGLSLHADEFGDIPLVKLQDAKIGTTRNINFQTPPEVSTYRKAVARTYKEVIEEKSKFPVKAVNKELAKYYEDLTRLENLDGRRVKGGRLGKHFAQLSGNVIGGAAGMAGGAPGAAIGAVIGGEVSRALQGRAMAGSFGRAAGRVAPENPILTKAKADAQAPKQRDLKKADPIVGAAQNVPKNKEIFRLEKEIKENVAAQKRAIVAKDYTLVQKLKEIYDQLVEKLKAAIHIAKTTGKRGFAKIGPSNSGKSGKPTQPKSPPESQTSRYPTTLDELAKERDALVINTGRAYERKEIKSVPTEILVAEDAAGYSDLDADQVAAYIKQLNDGKTLEPLRVYMHEGNLLVEDGKHKLAAYRATKTEMVDVIEVPLRNKGKK